MKAPDRGRLYRGIRAQDCHDLMRFRIMDILLAWMLPAAALLMMLGHPWWPPLALAGGAVYLYFCGVFMITRVVLKRRGVPIGRPSSVLPAD